METIARFAIHVAAATLGSVVVGFIVTTLLHPSGASNFWFDVPYGPPLWGTALVLGACLNSVMTDQSAKWAWTVGLLWLGFWCSLSVADYSPQLCHGCTLRQWIWT